MTSVDVYSMAGVLCRMITNQLPFDVSNEKQARHRRVTKPKISKKIPKPLRSLLLSALDPLPQNRPQDGQAFSDALISVCPLNTKFIQVLSATLYHPHPRTLTQNDLKPEFHILDIIDLAEVIPPSYLDLPITKRKLDNGFPRIQRTGLVLSKTFYHKMFRMPCFSASVGGTATSSSIHKLQLRNLILSLGFKSLIDKKRRQSMASVCGRIHGEQIFDTKEEGLQRLDDIKKNIPKWSHIHRSLERSLIHSHSVPKLGSGTTKTLFQWLRTSGLLNTH